MEILVVIGVTALLLSLVLPALSSARRRSLETDCLSRIRLSGVAIAEYTSDESGYVPVIPRYQGSDVFIDGIRARLWADDAWLETDYFGQGRLWAAVLAVQRHAPTPEFRCPSVTEEHIWDPIVFFGDGVPGVRFWDFLVLPSTYSLSCAFLAHPAFWRPDSAQTLDMLGPQRLSATAYPSDKALLFESIVVHRTGVGERTLTLSPPSAPVLFADLHARVEDFSRASPGVPNRWRNTPPYPMDQTRNGINGRDY